jgi:hypothetical protein
MPQQPFTDAELRDIANDPGLTQVLFAKLTPDEQARMSALTSQTSKTRSVLDAATGAAKTGAGAVGQALIGGAKEAGGRVVDLGRIVSDLPVIGDITSKLSEVLFGSGVPGAEPGSGPHRQTQWPYALSDSVFDDPTLKAQLGLEPEGRAQEFGAGAARLGEYFVPVGATGRAVTGAARRVFPSMQRTAVRRPPLTPAERLSRSQQTVQRERAQASARTPAQRRHVDITAPAPARSRGGQMRTMTRSERARRDLPATALAEALSAGGVSAVQGAQFPEDPALAAGVGKVAGSGLSGLISALPKVPGVRRVLPVMGAAALTGPASGIGGGTGGGQLSLFSSLRAALTEAGEQIDLEDLQAIARAAGAGGGRTAAAAEAANAPRRPPLPSGLPEGGLQPDFLELLHQFLLGGTPRNQTP